MNPENEISNLLTTNELAKRLKLHPETIRADRAAGNLLGIPYIHLGKSVRYCPTDIANWIKQHRISSSGAEND